MEELFVWQHTGQQRRKRNIRILTANSTNQCSFNPRRILDTYNATKSTNAGKRFYENLEKSGKLCSTNGFTPACI